MIAVISLESIRNVFTNQPNVYTQRRAICLIVRPLGVDLIFIYFTFSATAFLTDSYALHVSARKN